MTTYYCEDCGDEIDRSDKVTVRDESRPDNKTYYHEECVPADATIIDPVTGKVKNPSHPDDAVVHGDVEPSWHQSRTTVVNRFPALLLIDDHTMRDWTIQALEEGVPDYFFDAPATSSSEYHHPLCRRERGLWMHTLMGATAFEELAVTRVEQDRLSEHEVDCGRAAILLHDTRKHGVSWMRGESARDDHDLLAASYVREDTRLPDKVADAIASHMGAFDGYAGPAPETELQQAVHDADMLAASGNITPGVFETPAALREQYPTLPSADYTAAENGGVSL